MLDNGCYQFHILIFFNNPLLARVFVKFLGVFEVKIGEFSVKYIVILLSCFAQVCSDVEGCCGKKFNRTPKVGK